MARSSLKLDAETLLGFSGAILSERYDEPKPSPDCHVEWWNICCSKDKYVAIAAPRGHAKSTAITHAYVLANVLFRIKRNVMILSDTQDQAVQFLHDIKVELTENEVLREEFSIHPTFVKDSEREIIIKMGSDNHTFRIFAKGSEQSLRGAKWRSMRPDLVVGDDMENDEMVVNPERRAKLKKWFLGTLLPILSDSGQIRIVGTILHLDSLLEWMLHSQHWTSRRYEAHNDDFSEILWPDKWSKERLLAVRAVYEEAGELEIYLQEYRNIPIDDSVAMFRNADFVPLDESRKDEFLEYYVSADFAVSTKTRADYTVFLVVGVNKDGKIRVVDVIRGRFDSLRITEIIFELESKYRPQMFIFEDENITKSIGPFLYQQMHQKRRYPIIDKIPSTKDLQLRVKSWVARMRAGGVEFDTEAEWYTDFKTELKVFPRGKNDDQVSACALMGMKLQALVEAEEKNKDSFDDYDDDEEIDDHYDERDADDFSRIYNSTGY